MPKNNIQEQVKAGEAALVRAASNHLERAQAAPANLAFFETIGAAKAVSRLTLTLTSQLLLALKRFQEEKGYLAYGCESFVDFLAQNPQLDMSKTQYYRLNSLLEAEGGETFDLLNSLNVPLNTRKQISSGSIEVNGDTITVGDKTAPVSDAKAVKALFREAADAFERAENAAQKEQQKLTKLMKRAGFKFGKDETGKEQITPPEPPPAKAPARDDGNPAVQAYLRLCAAYAEFTRELAECAPDAAGEIKRELLPNVVDLQSRLFQTAQAAASAAPSTNPLNISDEEIQALADSL